MYKNILKVFNLQDSEFSLISWDVFKEEIVLRVEKQNCALKRLSLDETQGQVVYQYGKHSTEIESMDYVYGDVERQ